jgi:hypothetical protein
MGTKLSIAQCPTTPTNMESMAYVPYASAIRSLMYVMVCTKPNITQAMGVLNQFMDNCGGQHWVAMKRVFKYL